MSADPTSRASLARQFVEFEQYLDDLRVRHQAAIEGKELPAEAAEVVEALDSTVEELRVALEELQKQNHELRQHQLLAEASRRRYQELFESAPDGYFVTDLNGTIREANRSIAKLLCRQVQFLRGKPITALVAPAERSVFRTVLNQLKSAKVPIDVETQFLKNAEGAIDAALRVSVARDEHGRPVQLQWAVRDISDRKRRERQVEAENVLLEERVADRTRQLEAEYQEKEQWLIRTHAAAAQSETQGEIYRDLVEDANAILWTLDAVTGRYTFVSRRAEELLGYPATDWLADPEFWADRLHADDRTWALSHRQLCLRESRDQETEYRLVAASGRVIWFRESVRIVRDDSGQPRELRGLMMNVSKRKKIERQLYSAKHALASRLDDITYLYELGLRLSGGLDLKPMLSEVLAAVTSLLGTHMGAVALYDPERDDQVVVATTGLPEDYATIVGCFPRGHGAVGKAMETRSPVIVEDAETDLDQESFREARERGGYRALFVHPMLTQRDELVGALAVFFAEPHRPSDRQVELVGMYARQAAEFVENARLHAQVEESDQRKGEFLAIMAHELRTPLAAILNASKLLHEEGTSDDALRLARGVVERQTRYMSQIVDDLLDATRLRHGTLELRVTPTDLASAVARAVEDTRNVIDARNHHLVVIVPPEPLAVLADPTRLEQVLVNLLTNAAKYTELGGRITLVVEQLGGEAVIRVADTGVGISAEQLPKVFDLFMQAEPGADRSRKGLGIGLWIVRRLVELHGGRISVASDGPGRGTEFTVLLPLTAESPPATASTAPVNGNVAPPSHLSRVLVVDDDHDSARVLGRLLRGWGHDVDVAYDGPAALDAAQRFRPDVILLDLGLPGIDGFEVARRLRAADDRAGLRIMALTGFSQPADLAQARAAGIDDVWIKPVAPESLRTHLLPRAAENGA